MGYPILVQHPFVIVSITCSTIKTIIESIDVDYVFFNCLFLGFLFGRNQLPLCMLMSMINVG